MTVRVNYTKDGKEKSADFDSEQEANIFITGLRNHGHRSYQLKFKGVTYPEEIRPHLPAEQITANNA